MVRTPSAFGLELDRAIGRRRGDPQGVDRPRLVGPDGLGVVVVLGEDAPFSSRIDDDRVEPRPQGRGLDPGADPLARLDREPVACRPRRAGRSGR